MNRLLEKSAIFLLCLPGFLMAGSIAVPVLALLSAVFRIVSRAASFGSADCVDSNLPRFCGMRNLADSSLCAAALLL